MYNITDKNMEAITMKVRRRTYLLVLFIHLVFFLCIPQLLLPGSAETSTDSAPKDIEDLFRQFTADFIKLSPETATRLGITKAMGYDVDHSRLDDESEAALDEWNALFHRYRRWLDTYEPSKLTASQRLAAEILTYSLDHNLEQEKFREHTYIINHNFGFHNSLLTLMTDYHNVNDTGDADDYISRLGQFKQKFHQLSIRLKKKAAGGLLPPRHIIEKLRESMETFIAAPVMKNILYTSFIRKLNALTIDKNNLNKLALQAKEKIENQIYPAYRSMIILLEELQSRSKTKAGVWQLPNGDQYYALCLRYHTGTSLTPKQIHKIGLREVRRIQKEIKKRFAREGYSGNVTFGQLSGRFWSDENKKNPRKQYYPNTTAGKLDALKDFKKHLQEINKKLPELFSIMPRAQLDVKPVPAYKAATMGTHYSAPLLDGSRGGIFYVSMNYPPWKPGMKTLAIHEGLPGHHFQIAIEKESTKLRMFRNCLFFTSYVEGWALYAEKLGMEYGWFEDIYSQIGYLSSELFRAVRLVVDTGIHYKRWSRDRAADYLRNNLGWTSFDEIDRYMIWPGQACAYKMGELKILELRKMAQDILKKKFDIKEFHTAILQYGSVPLSILETLVKQYITSHR
jgi:uncharacterized protein (DUF885 family)